MKITRIRSAKAGLDVIASQLQHAIKRAGYISEVRVINSSRIDIGMHMCSFRVDVNVHGYNARYNPHMKYKAGYARTATPTWDQRVDFNNIVNSVLDKFKVSANVKSGDFIIRKGTECMTEDDWFDQKPEWMHHNEMRGFRIESLEA